jgi:8-oxo-dGTP pyrophosphatase MutT (NUDIX family)
VKDEKKIIYNYSPFIKIYRENFKNKYLSRKNFHQIKLQDAAMVILVNNKKQILFLNEYRRGIKQKSLGFPGGHIEKGETPLTTVKRELLEETGCKAIKWKLLFKYTRHGTYDCGKDYIYIAKLDKVLEDKNSENVQKKWLNYINVIKLLERKKFKTVGIIASVLYYIYLTDKKKWKI